MFVPIVNEPVVSDWGSETLIQSLAGRPTGAAREAEVWFGAHPLHPALVIGEHDRVPLDAWLRDRGDAQPGFLAKLLAAAAPLSIQVHPNAADARAGWDREEALGIDRAAPERVFKDRSAKPELIVAESSRFIALAGVRPIERSLATLRLVPGAAPLIAQLEGQATISQAIAWLLSGDPAAADVARAIADAVPIVRARGGDAAEDADTIERIVSVHPNDPGVGVALLLHRVELVRGEGIGIDAGAPHCYLDGLGIELLGPSDNVLRGGLTTKHVDAGGFARIVDGTPGPAPILTPERDGDLLRWQAYGLVLERVEGEHDGTAPGQAVIVSSAGTAHISARAPETDPSVLEIPAGAAAFTDDLEGLRLRTDGTLWIARSLPPV